MSENEEPTEEQTVPEIKHEIPRTRHPVAKVLLWFLGILLSLIVILFIASFFLDEPLRRVTEQKMNSHLKGYSVRLPGLHFQLVGLTMTLKGLTVRQEAHPEPPIATFPLLQASVDWRALLHGRLVAQFDLDRPRLNINLQQLQAEAKSKVPVKERGWQQAVEDIYPLKINVVTINGGALSYVDVDAKNPISLSDLDFSATNIRNVHLPDKVYPSSFHLDTAVFGTGHAVVDGRGNFLAEPIPAVKARFKLEKVPIDRLKPVVARANVAIKGGTLDVSGDTEYGPKVASAHIENLVIRGMEVEYLHAAQTAAAEERRAEMAKKAARKVSNKPDLLLRIDQMSLRGCNLGMRNQVPGKRFRVFLTDADLHLANLSNQFTRGPAQMRVQGRFMGSGATSATATFRPEQNGPDLDLYLKIDKTQLTTMNDLLRAYGNFDVAAGYFSLVTELHVKNQAVQGYLKPFFGDLKVYDRRKDKEKSLFHKMYELLVGGVAKLLENRPRQEVATKANISGPLQKPHTSSWQIVVQLVRNAFFRAILPTFERQVTGMQRR